MNISEMITDRYKLRIPPTVYYDLLADVREAEEEQESQTFKWCTDCREYDQEKHCCHRWSKVIRNTVEEMKQEYIEREVLDKIYADIQKLRGCSCSCSDGIIDDVEDILDKYKGESEGWERAEEVAKELGNGVVLEVDNGND